MTEDIYRVEIENIFEGPMDLLVYLIRKNEVNIYDIPIAIITDRFLAYIEWLKAMNIDFAGDFLVMASTLTQIKSKLLLPVHPGDDEEMDDPRNEIARPLIEYMKMKSVAEQLGAAPMLDDDVFGRNPEAELEKESDEEEMIFVSLFELVDAFSDILDKLPTEHRVDLTEERISIKDRIEELIEVLEDKGSAALDELIADGRNNGNLIVTFLAILEMARLCLIHITQQVQSGKIRIFYPQRMDA